MNVITVIIYPIIYLCHLIFIIRLGSYRNKVALSASSAKSRSLSQSNSSPSSCFNSIQYGIFEDEIDVKYWCTLFSPLSSSRMNSIKSFTSLEMAVYWRYRKYKQTRDTSGKRRMREQIESHMDLFSILTMYTRFILVFLAVILIVVNFGSTFWVCYINTHSFETMKHISSPNWYFVILEVMILFQCGELFYQCIGILFLLCCWMQWELCRV